MLRALALSLAVVLLAACGGHDDPSGDVRAGHDDHTGHVHAAPRGGELVVLAEETAHAEVVLDTATGRLSVYLLGPHAASPVRTAQATLDVRISRIAGADTAHVAKLDAQASELTGETAGDTSEFAADVPELIGATSFAGVLVRIDARGSIYTDTAFTYPQRHP